MVPDWASPGTKGSSKFMSSVSTQSGETKGRVIDGHTSKSPMLCDALDVLQHYSNKDFLGPPTEGLVMCPARMASLGRVCFPPWYWLYWSPSFPFCASLSQLGEVADLTLSDKNPMGLGLVQLSRLSFYFFYHFNSPRQSAVYPAPLLFSVMIFSPFPPP